ncbi:MAG: hypothetical protein KJ634_00715 [Gammaproteobacteria bacterium]|nr:hypothetical protein [Gammaproteobacteria bacterium]MBU1414122.1 hypothetical protein [Gammaproteobacteria bacterium]
MSRLEGRSPDRVAAADRKEKERQDLGRRDYDATLAKRLEQLRNALGTINPVMPPAQQPALVAVPASPPAAVSVPAVQCRGMGAGTMFIAALLSAALGAGAMWLAVGAKPLPAAPQTEVASAPSVAPVAVPVQAAPVAEFAPAPTIVSEPASTVPVALPSDDDQVHELIDDWRLAWADRDVEAYLACYSPDFTPANGQTRDAWVEARRENITTRRYIVVKTNDLKLERLDARRMKASFLQDYESGRYRETAQPKTLLLVRGEAGWEIAGEWQGEAPASALAKR